MKPRTQALPGSLALTLAGCMGSIAAEGTPRSVDTATPTNGAPRANEPPAESAGPRPLSRLSVREYNNTVRDLLGLASFPGITLPKDGPGSSGFLTVGEITDLHAETYLETAESLASAALQSPFPRLLTCTPTSAAAEEACAGAFIRSFGKRAFRRPLVPDEMKDLTALYHRGRDHVGYGFREA